MKHLTEKQLKLYWWYRLPASIVVMVVLAFYCLWALPFLLYQRVRPSVIWFLWEETLTESWNDLQGPV